MIYFSARRYFASVGIVAEVMNNIQSTPFELPRLLQLLDLMVDAVCVVDVTGRLLFVSAAGTGVFGYEPVEMIGRQLHDFLHPADRERTVIEAAKVLVQGTRVNFENRYVRKDGGVTHVMWTARWSDEHKVRIGVARDVTKNRRTSIQQKALFAISEAASEAESLPDLFKLIHEVVRELLPATSFSVSLYDQKTDILAPAHFEDEDFEPMSDSLGGSTLAARVVRDGRERLLSRDVVPNEAFLYPDIGAAVDWLGVPLMSKKGVRGALIVRSHLPASKFSDEDIELLKFIAIHVAAAIDRKNAEMQLQRLAHHDPLTGLVNRTVAEDRIATALARARRVRSRASVLYLDLDMFKQVNDSFGHAVGDSLLRDVSNRIQGCIRASDTAARMGGDEFLVLLSDVHTLEDATVVAEKIRIALCGPFYLVERNLYVSPSIGLSSYPEHGDDVEQLIRRADDAMYVAKQGGGNRMRMAVAAAAPDATLFAKAA